LLPSDRTVYRNLFKERLFSQGLSPHIFSIRNYSKF
jgi:hypothetical protein